MRKGQIVDRGGVKIERLAPWYQWWGSDKYVNRTDYEDYTDIRGFDVNYIDPDGEFAISLDPTGKLSLQGEFVHDGPSGPTWDTPNTLRAAFEHDLFFFLLKMDLLPFRMVKRINDFFEKRLVQDGMNKKRAWAWKFGVNTPIALRYAKPKK